MYDLHLHSRYSDGDLSPAEVVQAASKRQVQGLALTDHNCVGGLDSARSQAQALAVTFLEGIEISASYGGVDVHVLGYSEQFQREVMEKGLATTWRGYEARLKSMVEKCHEAGFAKISMEKIQRRRAALPGAVLVSYDIARELMHVYGMPVNQAYRLTIRGGACHVPYGDWALSPGAAIDLIHRSGGVAVLGHPGIVMYEAGKSTAQALLRLCVAADVDGLEVYHPFHDAAATQEFAAFALDHDLLLTGGSDWHGTSRFPESNRQFGETGIGEEDWLRLKMRIRERRGY